MIGYSKIKCNIPDSGIDDLDGYYTNNYGKVHLFLPVHEKSSPYIHRLLAYEINNKIYSQFHNCRLYNAGIEIDEFVVEETFLGEGNESFKQNRYNGVYFDLSSNALPFFNSPWKIENKTGIEKSSTINFIPEPNRKIKIELNDNTVLIIHTGYTQTYSKEKYEARSSVSFQLLFKIAVTREAIFEIIEAIAAYYSIFCFHFANVIIIKLITEQDIIVQYVGKMISPEQIGINFGDVIIEQSEIIGYDSAAIVEWVKNYSKCKIPVNLIKDSQQINDEQLRFICLIRCLEVFHKEFFINAKPEAQYFENLHDFATTNSMTDILLPKFKHKDITLSHRLYDLARNVSEITLDKAYLILFGVFMGKDGIQKLSDSRNYYIHFSNRHINKIWRVEELGHVNKSLEIFIKALFLKQLDFDADNIRKMISKFRNRYLG